MFSKHLILQEGWRWCECSACFHQSSGLCLLSKAPIICLSVVFCVVGAERGETESVGCVSFGESCKPRSRGKLLQSQSKEGNVWEFLFRTTNSWVIGGIAWHTWMLASQPFRYHFCHLFWIESAFCRHLVGVITCWVWNTFQKPGWWTSFQSVNSTHHFRSLWDPGNST